MIIGTVNAQLEAIIRIKVHGPNGQELLVTTAIDTGYNGYLTLPISTVTYLGLVPDIINNVTFADGRRSMLQFYKANIAWAGKTRRIRVLPTPNTPLLGTALLSGYHLGVDFVNNGTLTITPLQQP